MTPFSLSLFARIVSFILALFGVEYAINMEKPSNDGYREWLTENSYKSPLHP